MSTIEITIDEVLLEVEYEFDEGEEGGYFEPSTSDSIDILKVTLENSKTDITDLLSKYVISEIENKIYHYERLA
jgi:hypothetical protein